MPRNRTGERRRARTPVQARIEDVTGFGGQRNNNRRGASTRNVNSATRNFGGSQRVRDIVRGRTFRMTGETVRRYDANRRTGDGSVGGRPGVGTTRTMRIAREVTQPTGGSSSGSIKKP